MASTIRLPLRISPAQRAWLRRAAKAQDISVNRLLRQIITVEMLRPVEKRARP